MVSVAEALAFLESQRVRQSPLFPASQGQFVLAYLGTTSARGVAPVLTVHELGKITSSGASSCRVELTGAPGREPARGESVTVSITDGPRYRGYQLKTAQSQGAASGVIDRPAPGRFEVHASQVFTVHHLPNTVHVFETVPFSEVEETVRRVRRAVVGVGPMVNISPRFIICWEVRDGALALFHGDGEANKTWMNLQQNASSAHAVMDHEDGRSMVFEGQCREAARADYPGAFDELYTHYVRIGYGLPSRVYRLLVTRVTAG